MRRSKKLGYVCDSLSHIHTHTNTYHNLQYWIMEERVPRGRLHDFRESLGRCTVLLDRLIQFGLALYGPPPSHYNV